MIDHQAVNLIGVYWNKPHVISCIIQVNDRDKRREISRFYAATLWKKRLSLTVYSDKKKKNNAQKLQNILSGAILFDTLVFILELSFCKEFCKIIK